MCRTYELDGIPFDLGPHIFFSDTQSEVARFYLELLEGEPLVQRTYRFAIQAGGRYYKFPLNAWEVSKYKTRFKVETLLALAGVIKPPAHLHPESFARLMHRRSGPGLYEEVFHGLVLKKTLTRGEDLHAHWWLRVDRDVHNRLEPPPGIIKSGRLLERIKRKSLPWYDYPRDGFQRIPELLHQRYSAAGGRTITDCGPLTLTVEGDRVVSIAARRESFPVKELVWTGSVNQLNRMLGAEVEPLPFLDLYIVCLTYDVERPPKRRYVYTYHPQPELVFNRIYYPANIHPDTLPAGREGLVLEINVSPEMKGWSAERVVERATADVERLGLHPASALRKSMAVLIPDCLPVYPLDYQERLAYTYAKIGSMANLHAVGRQGGHLFALSPMAMGQGLKIAKHLIEG
jgi:protoporphyrinogen oxidase